MQQRAAMMVTIAAATVPPSSIHTSLAGAPASTHSNSWVRGPLWDGLWILNALWLLPLALWLVHGYPNAESSSLDRLYFGLTALFWIGHRFSSAWLAYTTEAYRPLLRNAPLRFVVLPLLVLSACFVVFLPADGALPWTREERLVVMAILDYGWGTYHFAAQHFGALSLYRLRAGRGRCAYTRRLDWIFALGVGGALVFLADVLAGSAAYQDRWIGSWSLTAWLVAQQADIRAAALLLLLAATLVVLMFESRAPRRSLPRVLYVLGLAAMVAIALQPRSLFLFLVVWTSQHWVLATGLASRVPSAESTPGKGIVRRTLHTVNARPWAIVLILVVASVLLLPVFEVEELAGRTAAAYADRIFGALSEALRTSSWLPALVAAGFASGFVHYLLDRSIYRMSDPGVRAAARGLLASPMG
ncbi:MAG TPA: hypothetical protein VMG11_14410 [Steroidobacteraceae bacterium]|nr:hypothetical protein [Steroidobacteraceae bacterium]